MKIRQPIGAAVKVFVLGSSLMIGQFALAQTATAPLPPTSARYLAANCANCHGTDGKAAQGGFNLAGLPRDYLIQQMAAFKAGTRQATIMHQIAKGYSDAQIALMADYFSKQKAGQ